MLGCASRWEVGEGGSDRAIGWSGTDLLVEGRANPNPPPSCPLEASCSFSLASCPDHQIATVPLCRENRVHSRFLVRRTLGPP